MYKLCGHCLHSVSSHEPHNGKFMYCASCMGLCDIDEFSKEHKPSSTEIIYEIQSAREFSEYIPNMEKKIMKQEKLSQEELWSRYSE